MTQVAKVKREALESCMTCPICEKLLKEATTISLCLHTFCRKCIYEKLSDDEVDSCPVCDIDLGILPVEKLRPDHNLGDIRAKIFPYKRRKIEIPEVMPSVSPPAKRKERSLSSLAVSAPKASTLSGLSRRRSKASARKAAALQECGYILDELSMKEDSADDHLVSSSSADSPKKNAKSKRQDSFFGERSNNQRSNEDIEGDVEAKAELWTPLNCLVEAANITKLSKLNMQGPSLGKSEMESTELLMPEIKAKTELIDVFDSEPKAKANGMKGKDEKDSLSGLVKRRRLRAADRKRAAASEELRAMIGAARVKHNRKNNPIWFTLVASEDEKGEATLPQIPGCYVRIKDGKMPVSFIQKYLVKKLDLASEAAVEIMCRGQPVLPTLQLHNLIDLWFRTASTPKRVPACVGGSAKDFVMVLSYCLKL